MLTVFVGAACLLGACTTTGDPVDQSQPVNERAVTSPPGTELGDGFVVAEGSALIGPVFPGSAGERVVAAVPERSWSAHLVVTGHPLDVYRAYLDQAAAAGFRLEGPGRCHVYVGPRGFVSIDGPPPSLDTEGGRDEPEWLRCQFSGGLIDGPSITKAFRFQLERRLVGDQPGFATMHLDDVGPGVVPSGCENGQTASPFGASGIDVCPHAISDFDPDSIPTDLPFDLPPIPDPALPAPQPADLRLDVDVVDGTQLVAVTEPRACPSGYYAILQVDGDIDEVVDEFETLFALDETSSETFRSQEVVTVLGRGDDQSQSVKVWIGGPDEPSFALLNVCEQT